MPYVWRVQAIIAGINSSRESFYQFIIQGACRGLDPFLHTQLAPAWAHMAIPSRYLLWNAQWSPNYALPGHLLFWQDTDLYHWISHLQDIIVTWSTLLFQTRRLAMASAVLNIVGEVLILPLVILNMRQCISTTTFRV